MPNQYVNKVVYGGSPIIDLTDATATAADIAQGKTAYIATGEKVVGTSSGGGGGGSVWQDQDGFVHLGDQGGGGGGEPWSWMGKNPTLVHTFPKEHSTFRELGVGDWTWSTTQTTLRAAQNYEQITLPNAMQYTYFQRLRSVFSYDYGNWSPSNAVVVTAFTGSACFYPSFSTIAAFNDNVPNSMSISTLNVEYPALYYNATSLAFMTGMQYGVTSINVPTPTGTGPLSTYSATVKKPILYIRGNSTYFKEAAFENLDLDASFYELECEVWRVDVSTDGRTFARYEANDILRNGL